MTKRVVLAYSGGLDTSVAVRWLIENREVEVIAVAVDVGQASESGGEDWEAIRSRALAAGAVEAVVVDARAEMAEDFCVPALMANAKYEGKYPLVSALSRPVIVKHLVAEARQARRRRGRPRLHREGERPGPLRGGNPGAGPRPRGHRPGPPVGALPRGLRRVRGQMGHPPVGDQGEAVLDRREPLGQGHRVRGDRGSLEQAARGRVHDDPAHGHRADRDRDRVRGRRAGVGRRSTTGPRAADRRGQPHRRLVRVRSSRHGGEPEGGHQEPGDLRVPGRPWPSSWPTPISRT